MILGSSIARPLGLLGAVTLTVSLGVGLSVGAGCKQSAKRTPTQEVGDAFVDHYLHADQDGALPYAALGAESQLKSEIAAVKEARDEGGPDIHASWKRTAEELRGKRVVLVYQVEEGEKSPPRTLRLELTDLGKGPKVVLFELQ